MLGKILIVSSRFGPVAGGISNTLRRMNVDFLECPIWNMEESIEKYQPQAIIFFHHFLKEWDKDMIDRLNQITCHKIYWDWECPWEIDYIRKYHHFFSKVLIQDKASVEALKPEDPTKFIHVPHAADKGLAELTIDIPFEYRSDLCFIGAAYPSRLKFFREILPKLKDYKIVIGGTGWEFLPNITGQKIINVGVGGDDYVKYYRGTKVALNLHRLSDEMPIANTGMIKASSPNNRFFELNMMGCNQVIDSVRQPELQTYYKTQLKVFNTIDEFLHIFQGCVRGFPDPEIQKETLEKHSYERRFVDIISKII